MMEPTLRLLVDREEQGVVTARRKSPPFVAEGGWVLAGSDGAGRPIRVILTERELRTASLGVSIGRHPALCGKVIDDPTLSRRHFRVGLAKSGLFIEDLNSLNGTLLDGVEVPRFQPIALAPGQSVVVGSVTLTVAALPTAEASRRRPAKARAGRDAP